MRTGIDLFAGIGGFSLAMQMNGIEVIEQVEIEPYPIKVLEKNFPGAKRHGDIRTYKPNANPWIVCGGFPCQDISSAGKGAGLSGKRSSLWWEMHRVIDESRPDWVLIENVSALRVRGADAVLLSLEELGYSSRAFLVGASDIKASHQRKRVWIVANSNSSRCGESQISAQQRQDFSVFAGSCGDVVNSDSEPVREQSGRSSRTNWQEAIFPALPGSEQYEWEAPRLKSRLGRTIDGISQRLDLSGGLSFEQNGSQEAEPTGDFFRWKVLRALWENQEFATAPSKLFVKRLLDSLPSMSCQCSRERWIVGSWLKEDQGLRNLWQTFYSKSFEEAQNLQQRLLKRIGKEERIQAVAKHRIKALGNAIVPQVAALIISAIIQTEDQVNSN